MNVFVSGGCDVVKRVKYDPTSKIDKIKYPTFVSEFEIQAYVYNQLLDLGYDVRGEVRTTKR